ncbi:hypothetical protein AB6864_06525 [Serratia proteamaculans]
MTYIAGRSAPWFAAVKWVEGEDLEIEFNCITSDLIICIDKLHPP